MEAEKVDFRIHFLTFASDFHFVEWQLFIVLPVKKI